jgi:hypothetical protein
MLRVALPFLAEKKAIDSESDRGTS